MAFLEDKNEFKEIAYKRKLLWFEEEFQMNFDSKFEYTEEDKELANSLMNNMSETLNQCEYEPLLYVLVETMNKLRKKYLKLLCD